MTLQGGYDYMGTVLVICSPQSACFCWVFRELHYQKYGGNSLLMEAETVSRQKSIWWPNSTDYSYCLLYAASCTVFDALKPTMEKSQVYKTTIKNHTDRWLLKMHQHWVCFQTQRNKDHPFFQLSGQSTE